METSIFIRSYRKDFQWLAYCLASIAEYCSNFNEVVLVIPETDIEQLPEDIHPVTSLYTTKEHTHGYIAQQITKLEAHLYTKAENILFVDSDCVFHTDCTPDAYQPPTILYTPYAAFPLEEQARCWQGITEKHLGFPVPNEYMRRIPLMFLRSTLVDLSDRYPLLTTKALSIKGNAFSEFNIMGAFAHKYNSDLYCFTDTCVEPYSPSYAKQFWSWGGITPAIKKEMEQCIYGTI